MFIIINKQIVIYYDGFDEMGGNRPRAIRIKVSHASVCTASKFSFSHLAPETNDCFDFKFSAHDFSPTFSFDAVREGTTKNYRIPDWRVCVCCMEEGQRERESLKQNWKCIAHSREKKYIIKIK